MSASTRNKALLTDNRRSTDTKDKRCPNRR